MKSKRRTIRRRAVSPAAIADEGSTPIPSGPGSDAVCGHGGCGGGTCNVRYVGPTSHARDHHALHAARGATHVWTAVIVSGVSLVLTGAIAYTSVEAKTDRMMARKEGQDRADFVRIVSRLEKMEQALKDVRELCGRRASLQETSTTTRTQ